MGKLSRIVFLLVAVTLSVKSVSAREIQYSAQIPAHQVALLKHDLNQHFSFINKGDALAQLLGIPVTSASIELWLNERVGYILEDSPNVGDNLSLLNSRYSYENPDLFPDIDSEADTLSEVTLAPLAVPQENPIIAESNGMVVASNVGTAIYLTGKQRRALIGYSFKTANNAVVLPITTPRAGLMMIGRGLFMIKINQTNPKSLADTILRTSVLLHEARHSDGNGKSLGFGHALCPQGHSYFGQGYACDRNINGPYNVEAAYLKQTRSDCVLNKTCTAEEAEGLALMAEDAYSRVISQRVLDARPEGH